MSWYAIDSADDAFDSTRSFLSACSLRGWLILGFIAIFVGVGGGSGTGLLNIGSSFSSGQPPGEMAGEEFGEPAPDPASELAALTTMPELGIIVAIAGGLLLLWLVVSLLTETLRFVFYEALHTGSVALLEPAQRRFSQALGLFGFKLAVNLVAAVPVVAVALALWFSDSLLFGSEFSILAGVILVVIFGGLLALGYAFVMRVTDEFVVPTMVVTDRGVLDGWRRFWPVLRGQLSQFAVYLVAHFLLLLAIGIGQSIVALVIYGAVLAVAALVGLVVIFGVFGGFGAVAGSTVGIVALVLLGVIALVAGFVLMLPVQVAVLTYVTSYEVSVLGAADEELQLLPESDSQPSSTDAIVS